MTMRQRSLFAFRGEHSSHLTTGLGATPVTAGFHRVILVRTALDYLAQEALHEQRQSQEIVSAAGGVWGNVPARHGAVRIDGYV
jgi:hypothetical protein